MFDPTTTLEHSGNGDQVAGDKIENHIKHFYQEQRSVAVCAFCEEELEDASEKKGNRIKCMKCEKWSYDQTFEARKTSKFPNVSTANHDEFARLKGRVENEIKLGQYEDALRNSEKLTKMCPEAPHSFLYNALSTYYKQSKDEIVGESAFKILKRLEIAHEKFRADEDKSDYDHISATIAFSYFYLLRGVLLQIYGFYINDKSADKRHTVNVYFKHLKELHTCYKIYPDLNFLKIAIEYFYGHHNFAWFEFEPNQSDYSDIKSVISEKLYSITEKHKGIKNLLKEMEEEILKHEPDYRLPEQRLDFSKVTGSERPATLSSLLQDVTIYSELIEKWEKNSKTRLEKAADVSSDDILNLIKAKNPTEYNHFRILRDTETREVYYYVNQGVTAIKREKVNYKLFLFPETKAKFFKITKEANWGVNNLKKYDGLVNFSSREADSTIVETTEHKDLPIKREKKFIFNPQPTYFFPDQTRVDTCTSCHGHKYLLCNTCNGRHKIPCETCRQQGYVNCNNCQSRGNLTCKQCSGSGYVMKNGNRVTCTKGILGYLDNSGCNGTGRITCLQCDGHGRTKCKNCHGETYTECTKCHGDPSNRETYGRIDCEGCRAAGEVGYFNTIRPTIIERNDRVVVSDTHVVNENNTIASKILTLYSNKEEAQEVYFKANEQRGVGHSETTKMLSDTLNAYHNIYYEKYPMLISERMYYEVVPVVHLKFKQILTNKTHELSIIDYDEPHATVIFHSNFKEDLTCKGEWSDIIDRAFYTRRYKDKIDKRNEIVLMIYMAKADWVIEEQEKEIIEDRISGIENFTKPEQDHIFRLMDMEKLPALDPKHTIFSSNQVENNVKSQLIKLIAEADGEYESSEKMVFNHLTYLIDQNRSKRLNPVTAFLTTWQVSGPVLVVLLVILGLVFG